MHHKIASKVLCSAILSVVMAGPINSLAASGGSERGGGGSSGSSGGSSSSSCCSGGGGGGGGGSSHSGGSSGGGSSSSSSSSGSSGGGGGQSHGGGGGGGSSHSGGSSSSGGSSHGGSSSGGGSSHSGGSSSGGGSSHAGGGSGSSKGGGSVGGGGASSGGGSSRSGGGTVERGPVQIPPSKVSNPSGLATKNNTKLDQKTLTDFKQKASNPSFVRHSQLSERDNKATQANLTLVNQRLSLVKNERVFKDHQKNFSKATDKKYVKRINDRDNQRRKRGDFADYRKKGCPALGYHGGFCHPLPKPIDPRKHYGVPCWDWFYIDYVDVDFYETWYVDDSYIPAQSFVFSRVFDPNDVLLDLATDVSGISAQSQAAFRIALLKMTQSIEAQVSQLYKYDFHLGEGAIIVNHYDNLGNKAYVIEGIVDQDQVIVSFRALLDLAHPEDSLVTVATGTLTDDEDYTNQAINQRVLELGGNPFQVDLQPGQ